MVAVLEQASALFDSIRQKHPLVVQLTNFVAVNDQANVTLALGASPIMSKCDNFHAVMLPDCDWWSSAEEEQADLMKVAGSLLINIGTVNTSQQRIMSQAALHATSNNKPIVLDPVGVHATPFRAQATAALLKSGKASIVTGNAAEIGQLAGSSDVKGSGVDSFGEFRNPAKTVRDLARELGAVVVMHGSVDWISDGAAVFKLSNGHERLGSVTGTGCSTGSAIAAFAACVSQSSFDLLVAAVAGVLATSIAGELAATRPAAASGSSSFRAQWIDEISQLTGAKVKQLAVIEEVKVKE